MTDNALHCASEMLEVLPLVMASLQCQMRHDPGVKLTIAQFRVLFFLDRKGSGSLSSIADFLGLGLPATSKIVDGLVNGSFIARCGDPADRRRVLLELSAAGRVELHATRSISQKHLQKLLAPLTDAERMSVIESMRILRPLFIKPIPGTCP